MKALEMFNALQEGEWTTSGLDVQWRIRVADDGLRMLEFQQTVGESDWRHNFEIVPQCVKPYSDMEHPWRAYGGFVALWKSVRDEVVAAALDCVDAVTGFSQGAALAVLAKEDLSYRGMSLHLMTFGCPRMVWGYVPDAVRARLRGIHVIVRGDIVTMVPPALLGYRRIGVDDVRGSAFRLPSPKWHRPDEYRKALA